MRAVGVALWYVVRPSASLGDLRIVATISDGNEVAVDAVRLTALASNDADAFSGAVRLSDLTVTLGAVDLASGGFVGPFGVMRTFTEQLGFAVENVAGNGMMLWPQLIQGTGSMIAVVGGSAGISSSSGLVTCQAGEKMPNRGDPGLPAHPPDGRAGVRGVTPVCGGSASLRLRAA